MGITLFTSLLEGLVQGTLQIEQVEMLILERNRVVELFGVLMKQKLIDDGIVPTSKENQKPELALIQIIKWRKEEITTFNHRVKQLKDAASFLCDIPGGNLIDSIMCFINSCRLLVCQ